MEFIAIRKQSSGPLPLLRAFSATPPLLTSLLLKKTQKQYARLIAKAEGHMELAALISSNSHENDLHHLSLIWHLELAAKTYCEARSLDRKSGVGAALGMAESNRLLGAAFIDYSSYLKSRHGQEKHCLRDRENALWQAREALLAAISIYGLMEGFEGMEVDRKKAETGTADCKLLWIKVEAGILECKLEQEKIKKDIEERKRAKK
jgi:hypothetical protein